MWNMIAEKLCSVASLSKIINSSLKKDKQKNQEVFQFTTLQILTYLIRFWKSEKKLEKCWFMWKGFILKWKGFSLNEKGLFSNLKKWKGFSGTKRGWKGFSNEKDFECF